MYLISIYVSEKIREFDISFMLIVGYIGFVLSKATFVRFVVLSKVPMKINISFC
jgi:hypothetical protein